MEPLGPDVKRELRRFGPVAGMAELLAASDLRPREREWANAVKSGAEHLCQGNIGRIVGGEVRPKLPTPAKLAVRGPWRSIGARRNL